jgi:Raf kinase inhibitor-like YbhB/YbcL family protein
MKKFIWISADPWKHPARGCFAGMTLLLLSTCALAGDFQLVSPAFKDNGIIPKMYTCEGSDINPPLEFKNVPPRAKSLVLTISDPDAPEGTWSHWIVYNISPDKTFIKAHSDPGTEGLNDFGKYAYGGPCPPDEKPHHYIFHAYALDAILFINEGPTFSEVEKAVKGHAIAKAQLTGLDQKPPF